VRFFLVPILAWHFRLIQGRLNFYHTANIWLALLLFAKVGQSTNEWGRQTIEHCFTFVRKNVCLLHSERGRIFVLFTFLLQRFRNEKSFWHGENVAVCRVFGLYGFQFCIKMLYGI